MLKYNNTYLKHSTIIDLVATRNEKGEWERQISYGSKPGMTERQGYWNYDNENATLEIRFHCKGSNWRPKLVLLKEFNEGIPFEGADEDNSKIYLTPSQCSYRLAGERRWRRPTEILVAF